METSAIIALKIILKFGIYTEYPMNSGCFPDSNLSNRTISLQNIHCAFFRQINRKGSFEYKDIRQLAKQQPGSGAKLLGTPAGSKPRSQHQAAQLHLLAWSGLGHLTARKHHLLRNNNAEREKIRLGGFLKGGKNP